jgi:hypothetical protein
LAQPYCAICAAQLKDPDAGWYFLMALLVSRMVFTLNWCSRDSPISVATGRGI